MSTVIVFENEVKANALLKEISRTPSFENGEKPVNVYDWESDKPLFYIKSEDGRIAISYPFDELTKAWLMAYLDKMAEVMEELPQDWEYPQE